MRNRAQSANTGRLYVHFNNLTSQSIPPHSHCNHACTWRRPQGNRRRGQSFSYLLRWGWSGDQLYSSLVCHHRVVSLVHYILPTAAGGSQVTHSELNCYRARNLHSLVGVYLSRGDLKLKPKYVQDVFIYSRFYFKCPV